MCIEQVIPSNHLILCHPLFLLPSIFPSIRVFSNESVLWIRWSKYWSFSFNISPSNEYSRLLSFRMDWFDLLALQGTLRVFSNTTVQKHQFFGTQLSLKSCPTLATQWTIACQAPLSMEFSRQEYWSGLPFPTPDLSFFECWVLSHHLRWWGFYTHHLHTCIINISPDNLDSCLCFIQPGILIIYSA